MHPELLEIPIIHLTIWSFGSMMVLGFLTALLLVRRLSQSVGLNSVMMLNATMYSLIIGVVGARTFFVVHYFDAFREDLLSVVAVWRGGLEFLGGVIPVVGFLLFYLRRHKLPIRRYLDIMAIGLMIGLALGRIGCFLNGCCFGKPTELPWGVRFPYGSFAYRSQVWPDPERDRAEPYLDLPDDYFGYFNDQHEYIPDLKPMSHLSPEQKELVTEGQYRCLPVHATQLYASATAGVLCFVLYLIWRRSQRAEKAGTYKLPIKPGSIFSLMFVLYGTMRFSIELLRDDNPFEIETLTISQIVSIALMILGVALLTFFTLTKPEKLPAQKK